MGHVRHTLPNEMGALILGPAAVTSGMFSGEKFTRKGRFVMDENEPKVIDT